MFTLLSPFRLLNCSNIFTWLKPFHNFFVLKLCGFIKTYFQPHWVFCRKCRKCILLFLYYNNILANIHYLLISHIVNYEVKPCGIFGGTMTTHLKCILTTTWVWKWNAELDHDDSLSRHGFQTFYKVCLPNYPIQSGDELGVLLLEPPPLKQGSFTINQQ